MATNPHPKILYLVDVDPAGKVTVLFPNKYAKENFLQSGTTYKMPAPKLYRLRVSGPAGPELVKAIATSKPLNIEILTDDAGDLSGLNGSAVHVAQAIVDQLKREVNRVNARGITILPAAPAEQPIATEGWATDAVLLRVVE